MQFSLQNCIFFYFLRIVLVSFRSLSLLVNRLLVIGYKCSPFQLTAYLHLSAMVAWQYPKGWKQ